MGNRLSDYRTVRETAQEWSITERQITKYIAAGRITGAIRAGNLWLIPKDAAKPGDRRRKEHKAPPDTEKP